MCFAQLAQGVIAIRSEITSVFSLPLASNAPLLGTVILTFLLQLAVIYVPAMNTLLNTQPLTLLELTTCPAAGLVILVIVEMEKWTRRLRLAGSD